MTANDPREAWSTVADELSALGLKLKLHLQQETSEELEDSDDDSTVERLGEYFDAAIDAIENASKDQAIRADLRETRQALTDAISATFRQVKEGVQKTSTS